MHELSIIHPEAVTTFRCPKPPAFRTRLRIGRSRNATSPHGVLGMAAILASPAPLHYITNALEKWLTYDRVRWSFVLILISRCLPSVGRLHHGVTVTVIYNRISLRAYNFPDGRLTRPYVTGTTSDSRTPRTEGARYAKVLPVYCCCCSSSVHCVRFAGTSILCVCVCVTSEVGTSSRPVILAHVPIHCIALDCN